MAILKPLQVTAERLRKAAQSKNTRKAYGKAWKRFSQYCHQKGLKPEKACPDDVIDFLIQLASQRVGDSNRTLSMGTLRLYRSALNRCFAEMNLTSPASASQVGDVLTGLSRTRYNPPRRVRALREYEISSMLNECSDTIFGLRDAAMISLGFAAALRRSELCNLRVEDVNVVSPERMIILVRQSKTDQQGKGQRIAVLEGKTIRPVSHLNSWLKRASIRKGCLFQTFTKGGVPSGKALSHSEVPRLVKKYAEKIGLDPADYSGHSLRAGFVTSAAVHHARLDKIMEITRHRNPATVLQYIRDADIFEDHAGAGFL